LHAEGGVSLPRFLPVAGPLRGGIRTAARILLEIGDASAFKTTGHPTRTGNRELKRAFFLAAFAELSDPFCIPVAAKGQWEQAFPRSELSKRANTRRPGSLLNTPV
jgi:hypothetical protein